MTEFFMGCFLAFLIIYILVAGIFYIGLVFDEELENDFPNPNKRALLCLLCGPLAWLSKIIAIVFSGMIIIFETCVEPLIDWLQEE